MMILLSLFFAGLCLGSFINCLVYRLNHNLSLLGRSFCPQCGHQLAWHDNTPLLSFVLLKGRCRYCKKKISLQYPFVELATGILTVLLVYHISIYDRVTGVYYFFLIYSLIAVFVSDLIYFTIPDEIVYPALAIVLGKILLGYWVTGLLGYSYLLSGLAAGLFFLALVLATRGQGMGMGDVKLAALMGFFLGYPKIIVALYLAFLTGALVGAILITLRKKKFGQHIPFGPFLTTSTIIAIFWGEKIWQNVATLL